MTDIRKAAEMALDWMERYESNNPIFEITEPIQALRQALAQSVDAVNMSQERVDETVKREHEPYGYLWFTHQMERRFTHYRPKEEQRIGEVTPIYTAPPKREWVGLTDDEIYDYADKFLYQHGSNFGIKSFGKAVEAKLKEKNT